MKKIDKFLYILTSSVFLVVGAIIIWLLTVMFINIGKLLLTLL